MPRFARRDQKYGDQNLQKNKTCHDKRNADQTLTHRRFFRCDPCTHLAPITIQIPNHVPTSWRVTRRDESSVVNAANKSQPKSCLHSEGIDDSSAFQRATSDYLSFRKKTIRCVMIMTLNISLRTVIKGIRRSAAYKSAVERSLEKQTVQNTRTAIPAAKLPKIAC